ncbi:MAG: hypothetical protein K0Q55_3642 [Verrucomicrobia bacterium]|jgi:hypothetical protein|nr:hypothetical protein [Verrucomicrobiota bacterium]
MNLPDNPYARSFLIGLAWLITVIVVSFSRHQGTWADYPRAQILLLVLISAITAAQLGVISSHFEKMRSWTRIIIGTMVGWFAIVGIMLLLGKTFHSPKVEPTPQFATTDAMMNHLANEAVKWVKQDRGVTLDYSADSIKIIEEELGRIHTKDQPKAGQPGVFGTAMGYGAYVGEVIRRRDGGTWATDHPVGGTNSYPLKITKPDTTIFPVGWCFKRLINGEEDNVHAKFMLMDTSLTNQFGTNTNTAPTAP